MIVKNNLFALLALPLLAASCQTTPEAELPSQVQLLGSWDITRIEHSMQQDTTAIFGITLQDIDDVFIQDMQVEFMPNDSLRLSYSLPEYAHEKPLTTAYRIKNNQLHIEGLGELATIQRYTHEEVILTYPEEHNGHPAVATWTLRRL